MCTAIGFKNNGSYYFGRTLDVCSSHGEQVVISPRGYKFTFRNVPAQERHYAVIGMAHVANGFPLYYDAMNEKGLCIAGLNFPGNAVYHKPLQNKNNVAPFEVIPYILSSCANIDEARAALENMNVADINYSEKMPHTPLHWLIGDKTGEIAVESVAEGLKIYDDPAGVLTNNPPFETQLFNLKNYARLSARNPENTFAQELDLTPYSRGMGALGMPGDWSSPSRFVRAAFVKFNHGNTEKKTAVSSFFRILESAAVPKGCVLTEEGFQYTVYSSCMDTDDGTYNYTLYDDPAVKSVKLGRAEAESDKLIIK